MEISTTKPATLAFVALTESRGSGIPARAAAISCSSASLGSLPWSFRLRYIRGMNRMPTSPLISKGLQIAEKRLGIEELAKRLRTTDSMIRAWRMGHATMPEYKFLRLVDILNDLEPDWTKDAKP